MRDERRALKDWLSGLLPEGMSREDIAAELGVTRKTISTMLNPDQRGFGNGFTMLRYLRLVGAVVDAPVDSPGASRLSALEVSVAQLVTRDEFQEGLDTLREAIDRLANRGSDEDHPAAAAGP